MSLRTKILLCALANLALLAVVLIVFVQVQFATGLESILLAPGEERLRALGDELVGALPRTPYQQWNTLLEGYARTHRVDLGLVENTGTILAGNIDRLPPAVRDQLDPGPPAPPPPPVGRGGFDTDKDNNDKGKDKAKGKYGKGKPKGPPPPRDQPPPVEAQSGPAGSHPVFLVETSAPSQYWFGVRIPIESPVSGEPIHGTLLVRSSSILSTPLLFDSRPWLAWALGAAAITMLCWIPFIRGLTRSVKQITAGAEQIAEGRFDVQIATKRRDEIGHLSDALNRMASQLSGFVHGQKRFLGDVAHELSAPLARIQLALGILESRASEPAQQRYVSTLQEEVNHISGLVNELLHFTKAGLRADTPAPVNVAEIVRRVLEREAPPGSDVRLTEGGHLRVLAQPAGLFRALSNLVRNALNHAGQDGPIAISAHAENDQVLITVADHGPGLPEDALDRVFTPFYRLDDSRSRESGGVGLGLAIVKASIESSGGTVSCRNRQPKGLAVTIRLKSA